jgi:hypothetical protein
MEKENIHIIIREHDIPKIIFIVPYRDRREQQLFFKEHMKMIMSDYKESEYAIFYVHQCDKREFNRGAMKNIGFLFIKQVYPNDYKNITLVFNDVDTMPYNKNFLNYDTFTGNVKHFYGFNFTLGGIVSIKAGDFEKTNGFPNLWAWGYEDNTFQTRVIKSNLKIDRSSFYKFFDDRIMHQNDKDTRTVNKNEYMKYVKRINDGFHTIRDLQFKYDKTTGFINVINFNVPHEPKPELNKEHDFKNGNVPFKSNHRNPTMKMSLL